MNVVTEETSTLNDVSAITEAETEPKIATPNTTTARFFMWLVGGVALALFVVLALLNTSTFTFWQQLGENDVYVFGMFLVTGIICHYFLFTVSSDVRMSLSILVAQAIFIIFAPLPAAILGFVTGLWFELFITRRGLTFAVRTGGMYALCVMVARLVFELVGGQTLTGDLSLVSAGQVLVAFMAYRVVNEAILSTSQYLQGLGFWQLPQKRFIYITLVYLAMLPGALLIAMLKFEVGPVAVLLACGCVVIVSLILRQNSSSSLQGVRQLKQVRKLNQRLAYQNDRQKLMGVRINQTLDSFLTLVREYAGISQDQEAAVVEITATIEELSRTASQIAGAADNVASAAEKAIYTTEQGQEAVNSTIYAINEAREKVQEIASKILDLTYKSERIGEIVTTINTIAGEIRMLALNATIEASGAGPFGRRFSIVAAEVNQLADRSRQAAQQIREIIVEIQQATNSSVRVTEEGLQKMERSVAMASLSDRANQDIISVVQKTAQQAAAISLATQQQRSASEQVVISVHDVAVMIGQNAEKIASVSEASVELQRIARELQAENL